MIAGGAGAVSRWVTSQAPITVADIIDRTTQFFQQKGIESPRLDAQLLIAHALGKSRLELYLQFDYPLSEAEIDRARELVRRRAGREPVAYIIGKREFAGRDFKVAPGVLIPRPDTEVLVEEVQRELKGMPGEVRLLEFGVGSGAIAVTLAANHPDVRVLATEISAAAAAIAAENAAAHGVAERVEIRVQGDFAGLEEGFHGMVSNPPYIGEAEREALAPEVGQHEPEAALFAAEGGLQWYRFLAAEAARLLVAGGFLAVEIGFAQRADVEGIFKDAGLRVDRSVKDFAGHDRVVVARRR
jgi:release factor glutamine methyltransferase